MEQSLHSKEAFEKHLRTHFASLAVVIGASTDEQRGMIHSALLGTWIYAQKALLEEQSLNTPLKLVDGED